MQLALSYRDLADWLPPAAEAPRAHAHARSFAQRQPFRHGEREPFVRFPRIDPLTPIEPVIERLMYRGARSLAPALLPDQLLLALGRDAHALRKAPALERDSRLHQMPALRLCAHAILNEGAHRIELTMPRDEPPSLENVALAFGRALEAEVVHRILAPRETAALRAVRRYMTVTRLLESRANPEGSAAGRS